MIRLRRRSAGAAAPHCPLHTGARMELVPMPAPRWIHLNTDDAEEKAAALARRAWRCPIAGCGRVAPHLPSDDEAAKMARKSCPGCGGVSDGSGRLHGNNICRSCRREYLKKYKAGVKRRTSKQAQEAA
ncbi:MAG: hypothetical protein LAN84_09725 [Acidobacteriia bacterium]|nr:hypothetical protein [Terriglobia bacterium]